MKALVGDNGSGLVKDITDMDIAYKAADTALAGRTGKLETATTGMTYNATSGAMTTFAGGVTAGSFTVKVGGTDYGMSSTGALSALSITEAGKTLTEKYADKGNTFTKEEVTNAISAATSGIPSDETVKTIQGTIAGIKRTGDAGTGYTTTIENNTAITTAGVAVAGTLSATGVATFGSGAATTVITGGNVTAKGTVTAAEFVEGDKNLAEKYAGIGDAYTAEKAALKADKSAFDTLNETVTKASTGLVSKTAALEAATTGMTYDAASGAMTTFAGGVTANSFTVGATGFGFSAAGDMTAKTVNGVSITGTDAAKNASVGGYSLKTISDDIKALQESSGTGGSGFDDTNVKGIKRTDSGGDGNNDTTTIEDATSFTASGMKTSNLEAATAAIGGVTFAANGVMNNVASINGISFANGKVGGVTLSGGKVDGVDVGALKNSVDSLGNRVTNIENSGGGGGNPGTGGANTAGITRPDNTHTTIEGNTTIGADGVETNNLVASDSITIDKGETNQTVIDENGIHVGQNSSVVNDTDGFITDKGLYIGVDSSSNLGSAKFSVDPNGNLNSQAGNFGFSNTSTGGAKFTDTNSTAHSGGSVIETTIKGNTVETGRIDTDELWVGGNKVELAGTTVQPGTHINNHLEGNDASGNAVTNDFTTSALNGTTQSAEQVSTDGKNTIKTTNNTSATGTGITTTKTDVDSSDNSVVQKSELTTNESGMSLNTSNKVTDKEGNVTSSSSGATNMTGDSLTVSKTTVTKDGDGNDVTKTSSTTVDSGEVTLNREDGSSIRVGDAIEGLQSDVQEMGSRINEMGTEIKEVGALSAALAGLHPQPQNANTKADFAMAMGSYEGKQALAVGAFYKPDKRTMLSVGASTTSSKHMMNMGISIALDRMPEEEPKAQEQAGADNETLNKVLERLASLEQDNQRLVADNKQMALENAKRDAAYAKLADNYNELKEKYSQEKPAEKADDTAAESAEAKAKSE